MINPSHTTPNWKESGAPSRKRTSTGYFKALSRLIQLELNLKRPADRAANQDPDVDVREIPAPGKRPEHVDRRRIGDELSHQAGKGLRHGATLRRVQFALGGFRWLHKKFLVRCPEVFRQSRFRRLFSNTNRRTQFQC
jgi:hypothetical protein